MKINAKLVLNVTHHGSAIKKIFQSRSPKTTFNNFLPFYLTEKHQIWILYQKTLKKNNCFKVLCKQSFEKKMTWNSAYTQKKIISAFMKTLQIKLLTLQAGNLANQVQHSQETKFSLPLNVPSSFCMTCGQWPVPSLSPAQIKKKEAWLGDEKPTLS